MPHRVRNRRPWIVLVVALLASTMFTATPGYAAAKRGNESWNVGAPGVKISGHGYGHGRGMSQYGALGAAQQGLTWREIIDFYYPGTQWGTAKGRLRVLITADTTRDVQVVTRPNLRVRNLANGRTWTLPQRRARKWRMLPAGQRTRIQFTRGKGWKTWRRISGEGQFSRKGGPLTLVLPRGVRADYRGTLRSVRARPGTPRETVNVVPLEAYLRGVVPQEVPALWHGDAVSAQSVAARTYAVFERNNPAAPHYDLCDTTLCQVYVGKGGEHPSSDAAIKRTARQIVTHRGEPAFTQFSASSGGWTVAGSMPYLVAQADPYDDNASNTVHDWSIELTRSAIQRHWPAIGRLERIEVNQRDGNGEWGGRVLEMTLIGGKGRTTIHGETFRSVLGLRSSWFTFSSLGRALPRGVR